MTIPATIGFLRVAIENGLLWRCDEEFAVTAGGQWLIGFITGSNTVGIEARDLSSTGDDTRFWLYKGISFTGGTDVPMTNRNTAMADSPSLNPLSSIKTGVTATLAGSPIGRARIRVASGGGSSLNPDPDSRVLLLAPNTSHVLAVFNDDNQDCDVSIGIAFRRDVFIA
jgi:hypothetical protein